MNTTALSRGVTFSKGLTTVRVLELAVEAISSCFLKEVGVEILTILHAAPLIGVISF